MLSYMPVLCGAVVGSADRTEAFLNDYRLTIADLIEENYFRHFRDLCHRNNMEFHSEAIYGGTQYPPVDVLSIYQYADVPKSNSMFISTLVFCPDIRGNQVLDLMGDKLNRTNDVWYLSEYLYMMNLNETYIYFLATGYMRDDSSETHYVSDEIFAQMTHNDFLDMLDDIEK